MSDDSSTRANTIQFGNIVTEHELLSRTIPNLFSLVRRSLVTASSGAAPTWHRAHTPQPTRGAPHLALGAIHVARHEWSAGDSSTSLRGWHTPHVAPQPVVAFARVLRAAERRTAAPLPELAPRGLQNVSNDCFANSVLQLLVHCAPLRDWFERVSTVVGELEKRKGQVELPPLVRIFSQLLHDYRNGVGQDDTLVSPWSPFAKPLPPLKLASRVVPLVMPGRKTVLEQQDAQEFLFLLLDSLHASLLDAQTHEQDDAARNLYYYSDSDDEDDVRANVALVDKHAGAANNGVAAEGHAARANGGAAAAPAADGSVAAESEAWTEIGPASRKSVVITAEKQWRDSAVSRLLRGRLRSTLKRRNAKSSISIEPFFALSLEPTLGGTALPDKRRPGAEAPSCTLPELLKSFLGSERVATTSSASNTVRASEKQTTLEEVPPNLLVHIARFAFVNGVVRKLDTHVAFGTQLDVPTDLFAVHAAPTAPLRYRLRGVVRHHGAAATSGHYTACVLVPKPPIKNKPATEEWYVFNDTHVDPITEDAVLASQDSAYLLMYSRV